METLKILLGFVAGLTFILLYYRLVWQAAKLRSKELKLITLHGEDSYRVKEFRKRYKKFYHSRLFRFFLFIGAASLVYLFFGKPGMGGFFVAIVVGNLLLFPYGWIKGSNGDT